MVSPNIKHGKSEKIISKVTRRVCEMRSYRESGNEKAQPPMMRSKQRVGENIERNAPVSRPRKVGEISTSKNFIGETSNERDQFHVMRSNQWTDLEAIQHCPGRSIEVNGIVPGPRKVGQVPTLKNSVAQIDNKRDQLPNMKSNQGTGLEAIHQSIEKNTPLSIHMKNVQDMWYRRNNLFSDRAATLNNVHGFEADYHDPCQNVEDNILLSRPMKHKQDIRDCRDNFFFDRAARSKNIYGFEATYHDPSQNMENNSLLPSLRKAFADPQTLKFLHFLMLILLDVPNPGKSVETLKLDFLFDKLRHFKQFIGFPLVMR